MTQEKWNFLIMHLLVNTKTEILALKDILLVDVMQRNGHTTQEEKDAFMEEYEKMRREYQTEIIAQIRARYDDTLGNVDDLLNSIF